MAGGCCVGRGGPPAWFKSRLNLGVAGVDARRATPPDPILPAFTEAGRVRKPRPNQLLSGRVRPLLNGRWAGKSRSSALFAARRLRSQRPGEVTRPLHERACTKPTLLDTDQVYGRKWRSNRSSRLPREFIPAQQAYPVLVPGGLRVAGRLGVTACLAQSKVWTFDQTQVPAQGWLGSTPAGRRPQIRSWRAGGSLAVASSTPATPRHATRHQLQRPVFSSPRPHAAGRKLALFFRIASALIGPKSQYAND